MYWVRNPSHSLQCSIVLSESFLEITGKNRFLEEFFKIFHVFFQFWILFLITENRFCKYLFLVMIEHFQCVFIVIKVFFCLNQWLRYLIKQVVYIICENNLKSPFVFRNTWRDDDECNQKIPLFRRNLVPVIEKDWKIIDVITEVVPIFYMLE